MATKPERVVLTYEDYLSLPDDRNRYEILEGDLEVTPAPSIAHQDAAGNLFVFLRAHVRRHRLGKVLIAPCDVLLSEVNVVQPDLLFVSRQRQDIVLESRVEGAPDLVVEVISPTTARRDREVKRSIYARYGVPNYWLVDPDQGQLVAYVLEDGSYRQPVAASGDESFSAPPFADLAIPVSDIWA